MAKPDWLSIEEITRLWSGETGLDASAFQKDLEEWFAEFVKQPPASRSLITGGGADATNRLMGMLGARYLERSTFEAYCKERGYPKPRFWSGGRVDAGSGNAPSEPKYAPPSSKATPAPSNQEPTKEQIASDPDLAAFQTQIASLRDRLEIPRLEIPSVSEASGAGQPDLDLERGRTGASRERSQQELIEGASAASAEARKLKAQLESAKQQIAEVSAEREAKRASLAARPPAPGAAAPEPPRYGPTSLLSPQPLGSASYRDPNATGELLRQTTARPKWRGSAFVAAGLIIALVALLVWGADTVIQIANVAQVPTSDERADAVTGTGAGDGAKPLTQSALGTSAEQVEPQAAVQSLGRTVQKLGTESEEFQQAAVPRVTGSADALVVEKDLVEAQRQIARLNGAVAASDAMVARLRDELAVARQAVEAARETPSDEDSSQAREQLEAALNSAAETKKSAAEARAETERLHEENTRLTGDLAKSTAETTSLRTALRQAADQAEGKQRDLRLAATASAARVAALQRDLESAHQRVDELRRAMEEADSDVSSLRAALKRTEDEAEARRQDLTLAETAASARLTTLQRDLESAQRQIADLGKVAEAAEAEADKLREELAIRQQETAAPQTRATQPIVPTGLDPLVLTNAVLGQQPGAKLEETVPANAGAAAQSDQYPLAGLKESGQTQQAEDDAVDPQIEELLAAAKTQAGGAPDVMPSGGSQSVSTPKTDSTNGGIEQIAARQATEVAPQTDAIQDSISADALLLEPGNHLGRELVVTGSVVWILWRYRLHSERGPNSMVIDIKGLRGGDQKDLKDAINRVGPLGKVRARITGTIERHGPTDYRLAASELMLAE